MKNTSTFESDIPSGRLLAAARVRSGLTASKLAHEIGMNCSQLSLIEHCKRVLNVEDLLKIRKYVSFTQAEYDALWKQARKTSSYLKTVNDAVLTSEIIDNPHKQNLLIAFSKALSEAREDFEDSSITCKLKEAPLLTSARFVREID